jgi:PAS domain S-box-containing protein
LQADERGRTVAKSKPSGSRVSVPLAGYTTCQLLRTSARTRVYRAERQHDRKSVVAKVFQLDDAGVEARVTHEFRLLQQLDVEGVVRALGIERAGNQLVLLLDYVDGCNLEQHAGGQPMGVAEFLPKALSLTATLARIHERRVIHRDIKPSNILVERTEGAVFLADFGISVLLENERQHLYDPEVLTGTLPYISPEQTGRTAREVDFRSDLYSLGVTFYELLTGRRPFESSAPLELIHSHLARQVTPANVLVPTLPRLLSDIVMRLLQKAPEHRYQSARGLHADLERFAAAWQAGEGEPAFELGLSDRPLGLQLPRQLYGRERERALLDAELRSAIALDQRRLVVIHGGPGQGKSALIADFEASVLACGGYMALGRVDPRARDQPHQAFADAFARLFEQILTESDQRLARWREAIASELGPVAGVAVSLIPELSLVLGPVPDVPSLELGEARNRLHLALARLVGALARTNPLVLVIDDLHLADASSIALLHTMLVEGGSGRLLVIAALRDDELGDDHPIQQLEPVQHVELGPLPDEDLRQMLADALGHTRQDIARLATLVARKTANNPLLIRQLLIQLADLRLLRCDERGWCWDEDEIAGAAIPEDAIGMMRAKIERLAADERELLICASAIGASFEPSLLVALAGGSPERIAASLHALEREGLLSTVGTRMQFSHEAVRQSASDLDPPTWRRHRWALGQHWLQGGAAGQPEKLFAIVDALVDGRPEVAGLSAAQQRELAERLVEAGERALAQAAWQPAQHYFERGLESIADERAGLVEPLAFAARLGRAQALALAGENHRAAAAFDELLARPLTLTQHGRVVARRIRILVQQQRLVEAVEQGLAALTRCGIELPRSPSQFKMIVELMRAIRLAKRTSTASLIAAPEIAEERIAIAVELVNELKHAALAVDVNLFVILTGLHVRLILAHGFHPSGAEGIAQLAIPLAGMANPGEARRLSEAAAELVHARPSSVGTIVRTEASGRLFAGPSFRSFRECAAPCEPAARGALEVGERIHAGYYGALGLSLHYFAGTPLRELIELEPRLRRELDDFGTREMAMLADMRMRMIERFAGVTPRAPFLRRSEIAGETISELSQYAVVVAEIEGRLLLAFSEGELPDAELVELQALVDSIAHDYERVLFGTWQIPLFALLSAIVANETSRRGRGGSRLRLLRLLRRRLATARRYARGCPSNYEPLAEMVAGERARARGLEQRALGHYERARRLACEAGTCMFEAFAALREASLCTQLGWTAAGKGALQSAREAFERWGARGLVDRLARRVPLPELEPSAATPTPPRTTGRNSTSASNMTLDLASVLSTMQVISEDLRLDEVIARVLAAAMENAGADRGLLLLERDGQVAVVAEGGASLAIEFMTVPLPLRSAGERLATSVVHYVLRTGNPLVVEDLARDSRFAGDPYVASSGVRSLLCMPITKQHERLGALVLENRFNSGAFTRERLEVLRILIGQAASALDNARLYAALARSESQWRSLVDGAPVVVALIDEQGRFEFINHVDVVPDAPRRLPGVSVESILDRSSVGAWRAALAEAKASGERQELELCVVPTDEDGRVGERHWYMTRVAPIDGDGHVGKFLAIATDITERKRLEAQLRQQQRLEAIGTLASGVAHEINNPVQGILNYAELICERAEDPASVREFADEITTESERVANIVRNLLAFSRQEREQQREPVEIRGLIESTLSLTQAVMRKDNVRIVLELSPHLPRVTCRPQQIQQVIMNLVTNARDALNERYQGFDERKHITIRAMLLTSDDRPWLRLSVEDHGPGIPEHLRVCIFDPFFTTKGRDQGTGLGLAVSHGIASEHGGRLSVESELGVGTCFHLDLPV